MLFIRIQVKQIGLNLIKSMNEKEINLNLYTYISMYIKNIYTKITIHSIYM